MALSRTNLLGEQSSGGIGAGAFTTSGTGTTRTGELIVVVVCSNSGSAINASNLTISDSQTNSYTSRFTFDATPASDMAFRVWTAVCASGASGVTWTVDAGADSTDVYGIAVVSYSGANTTTPLGTTGSNASAPHDGAASLTLGVAPAATSEVIAMWLSDYSLSVGPDSMTPGSAFTELYDFSLTGHSGFEVEVRGSSTSTTVDLVDISVSNSNSGPDGTAGIAFEIQAATDTGAGPGGGGPGRPQDPQWMWTQRYGTDPVAVVTAAQPWAQILATPDTTPPLLAAQVYPGLNPQLYRVVPQAFGIQATAIGQPLQPALIVLGLTPGTAPVTAFFVPTIQATNLSQPPQSALVIGGLDPSGVETVPVPRVVQAAAIPGPGASSLLLPGLYPGLVETVPVPRFVQAGNIPVTVAAPAVIGGLDPSRVETVPLALLLQAANVPAPLQQAYVVLGLTPGTAPVTSFFVPYVQATNIGQPTQRASHVLGLTPGTPPVTIYLATTVQAAAIPQPLQTVTLATGLNPQLYRVVPQAFTTTATNIVPPLQRASVASVLNPQLVRTVPIAVLVQTSAIGQPPQFTLVNLGLVVAPPTFFPDLTPDIIYGREPLIVTASELAALFGIEVRPVSGDEWKAIYGKEPK